MWSQPDRLYGVPGTYRYVRCRSCRSVYQSPRVRPEELHRCYPEGYYTHGDEETGDAGPDPSGSAGAEDCPPSSAPGPRGGDGALRSLRDGVRSGIRWAVQGGAPPARVARLLGRLLARSRTLRERAFFGLVDPVIPRDPEPGRALEIGSGSGWELSLLARVGWKARGVEFDARAAERSRRVHGVDVRTGDFLEVVGAEERYDLIYLSHVLEHLPDLEGAFRFLRRHLRPGGRAVLVFPHARGLGARVWGRDWQGWDPPRHLVLPSPEGIRELARGAALRARVRFRAGSASFVHAASRAIARRRGVGEPARAGTGREGGAGRRTGTDGDARDLDPLSPSMGIRDRILGGLGGLLVALGFPSGEEMVVVLEPAERASPGRRVSPVEPSDSAEAKGKEKRGEGGERPEGLERRGPTG